MPHILVIQSRRREDMVLNERGEYQRAFGTTATLSFVSSLDETVSWDDPVKVLMGVDGVVFGGSGEFDFDGGRSDDDEAKLVSVTILERLQPLIAHLFATNTPTLGICYGHQILGQARGVRVVNDAEQKKVGTYEVTLTPDGVSDPLFAGLPPTFLAQYGHKDSLIALPEGVTLLATGARCKYSALRYAPNIYSVQFHPELTAEDVAVKLSLSPGYLPEGISLDDIVRPSREASTLLPRFAKLFS